VLASQCPRDGECQSNGEPQNVVSLLQTSLQTNVIKDVKTLVRVEVEEQDAQHSSQKLRVNRRRSVHLKVKMIQAGGREFPIKINRNDTVEDLKEQIKFAAGVPVWYIEFASAGRIWNDSSTIGSYEPNDGDIVHSSLMRSSLLFSAAPVVAPAAAAPKMFVAVFTSRSTSAAKRAPIRRLWSQVDAGSGNICARFIICRGSDHHQQSLLEKEHAAHGDFLFLDCAEGYAQGLLTKKVIRVLREYRDADNAKDACLNRPLFTKVDDDTFVAGRSYREGFSGAVAHYGSDFLYAGVKSHREVPDREVSSTWYEPETVFPQPNYPSGMYGGPGYTLGRALVHRIIDEKIADSNILWNEDRAVAVWVEILEKKGAPVSWVVIPGANGYSEMVDSGTWGTYPYTLHHKLSNATISCLSMLEQTNNNSALVDPCFLQNTLSN